MGGGGVDCFFTRWRDVYWVRLGGGDVGTGSVRFGGSGRISGGCDDDGLTIMAMVSLIFVSFLFCWVERWGCAFRFMF
ncbi:unnamed protein product [Prunus armeniaca]|uniref:Transmembrane protein n=1 Tax=Prunus armeniaca TaxID=36596 RepID=A0A6J5UZE2_PRUAR|nr:unnamed protein product [Prunus armeniaca]CAB4291386.1 unnamed protein product [Prunus armeniaca]CAB4317786.1 unnamed protein product [Prunus armeniaca]